MREPVFEAVDKREREGDEWLKSRPVCDICGEHIQEEKYYCIDGTKICLECLPLFTEWID